MTHSDDSGHWFFLKMVLENMQVVIVPIYKSNEQLKVVSDA